MDITTALGPDTLATITESLLAQLPTWFGIPEANAEYVRAAHTLPGVVAYAGDEPVGLLLHKRHFPRRPKSTCWQSSPIITARASAELWSTNW
ncbi:hypothetical protein ACXJJ3_31475 [Kribbella sp. WER1]